MHRYRAPAFWIVGVFAVVFLWPSDNPANADKPRAAVAQSSAYYRNCGAARAAGVAPLYVGQPGYRAELDRDGDGVACEPYRGR